MITRPMLDFCHYLRSASGILARRWSVKASLWQLEGLAERRSGGACHVALEKNDAKTCKEWPHFWQSHLVPLKSQFGSVQSSIRLDHPIVTTTQHQAKASPVEHHGWKRRNVLKCMAQSSTRRNDAAHLLYQSLPVKKGIVESLPWVAPTSEPPLMSTPRAPSGCAAKALPRGVLMKKQILKNNKAEE